MKARRRSEKTSPASITVSVAKVSPLNGPCVLPVVLCVRATLSLAQIQGHFSPAQSDFNSVFATRLGEQTPAQMSTRQFVLTINLGCVFGCTPRFQASWHKQAALLNCRLPPARQFLITAKTGGVRERLTLPSNQARTGVIREGLQVTKCWRNHNLGSLFAAFSPHDFV